MSRSPSCIYCGNLATTRDHIPPKNLFRNPCSDLITVPACGQCNNLESKDDEYFRNTICLEERVAEHPSGKERMRKVVKSLKRTEATGLRKSMVGDLRRIPRLSESGLYLGEIYSSKIAYPRIVRVIQRITKGLFYYHFNRTLPKDCEILVYGMPVTQNPECLETILELIKETYSNPINVIEEGVFYYRYAVANDHPEATVWGLAFFETIPFLALTIPQPRIENSIGKS